MTTFAYIARTTEGLLKRGSIDTDTMEHAREQLRKQHLFIEQIQAEDAPPQFVGFADAPLPWNVTDTDATDTKQKEAATEQIQTYMPLKDTLRLFAGWLLAWYGLVYLMGSLHYQNKIPVNMPFIEALFTSATVLRFTFGTFLFLLLTSLHRRVGGGVLKGLMLSVLYMSLLTGFHFSI